MRNIVITVVGGLLAFALGLVGVYLAMPALAPDVVEKAQIHLDSLAVADSLAGLDSRSRASQRQPDAAPATLPSRDTALQDTTVVDSVTAVEPLAIGSKRPDSAVGTTTAQPAAAQPAAAQPAAAQPAYTPGVAAMHDSLTVLHRRIAALEKEKEALHGQITTLRQQQTNLAAQRANVHDLSATLTKLEDKELARVVEQLDVPTLESLYHEASSRNRARLLQAMPAQYAARFVRRLVQPGSNTVPSDTLAAGEPANFDAATANR